MKKLVILIVAAQLMLIAGCSANRGNSDVGDVGMSGGATGTPSGTSNNPMGSGGGR